jgi:hypothetical protein
MTGIEANPDKIGAILQMQPSQTRKDVQKLTGRIATLNKFVVKLVERNLPFFTVLRVSAKKFNVVQSSRRPSTISSLICINYQCCQAQSKDNHYSYKGARAKTYQTINNDM